MRARSAVVLSTVAMQRGLALTRKPCAITWRDLRYKFLQLILCLALPLSCAAANSAGPADTMSTTVKTACLLSLIPAVVVLLLQDFKLWLRLAMALLSWSGSVALIIFGTVLFSTPKGSENNKWLVSDEERWQNNGARQAACAGNLPLLKRELNYGNWDSDSKLRLFRECAVDTRNTKVLEILLDDLKQSTAKVSEAHCPYLEIAMLTMDQRLLKVFTDHDLSLACSQTPWWNPLIYAETLQTESIINWLYFLANHGINLSEVRGSESLLVFAFENGDARLIHFALDLGIDPYSSPSKSSPWSPLQSWALRRHGIRPTSFLQSRSIKLETAEINSIQARLRELNAGEANLILSEGRRFNDWQLAEDGGAALFRYVVKQGAMLDLPAEQGQAMLKSTTPISAPLYEVLNQLSDKQWQQLACPRSISGDHIHPLYEEVLQANNQVLKDLIERRKIKRDCRP